jgi:hypothetical protein
MKCTAESISGEKKMMCTAESISGEKKMKCTAKSISGEKKMKCTAESISGEKKKMAVSSIREKEAIRSIGQFEKVEVEEIIEDEYDSKNDSAKPRMLSTGECCEAGISPQQSAGLDESCEGLMSCDDMCDPCEVFNEVLH